MNLRGWLYLAIFVLLRTVYRAVAYIGHVYWTAREMVEWHLYWRWQPAHKYNAMLFQHMGNLKERMPPDLYAQLESLVLDVTAEEQIVEHNRANHINQ